MKMDYPWMKSVVVIVGGLEWSLEVESVDMEAVDVQYASLTLSSPIFLCWASPLSRRNFTDYICRKAPDILRKSTHSTAHICKQGTWSCNCGQGCGRSRCGRVSAEWNIISRSKAKGGAVVLCYYHSITLIADPESLWKIMCYWYPLFKCSQVPQPLLLVGLKVSWGTWLIQRG